MTFDATTFALEVVNFLVLVWLLKHFFYRPVLGVIEQRRADAAQALAAAQALRDEAQALKADYETRLARAAEDRALALARLADDIAAERARRLSAVEADVLADRQRRQTLEARERDARDAEREHQAVVLAARFASRLLDRVAGPALDDSLVDLALADLQAMPAAPRESLQAALADPEVELQVCTAYPLSLPRREALTAVLGATAGRALVPTFREEPLLKAGLRIHAGAWVLMANLRDELEYFSAQPDHGR